MKTPPDIYADRFAKFSPEELGEIRAILTSRVYIKLMRVVACVKPSAHCKNTGSGERDEFSDARANARLGEIRGWEQYEGAIFLAIQAPKDIKKAVQETFPDSARVDAGWGVPPEKK